MFAMYAPTLSKSLLLAPFYALVTRIFLFRIGAVFGYDRPYEVIAKISPRPVFLMHGTADDLVPYDHSTRLFDKAAEPKYLWLAENAWHCALYDMYPDEFNKRIHEFLNKHLHAELVDQKPSHSADQVKVVDDQGKPTEGTTTTTTTTTITTTKEGSDKEQQQQQEQQEKREDINNNNKNGETTDHRGRKDENDVGVKESIIVSKTAPSEEPTVEVVKGESKAE